MSFEEGNTLGIILDDEWELFVQLVSDELEVDFELVNDHIGDVQIDDTVEYPLIDDEFHKIAENIGVTSDDLECSIRMNIDTALMG